MYINEQHYYSTSLLAQKYLLCKCDIITDAKNTFNDVLLIKSKWRLKTISAPVFLVILHLFLLAVH